MKMRDPDAVQRLFGAMEDFVREREHAAFLRGIETMRTAVGLMMDTTVSEYRVRQRAACTVDYYIAFSEATMADGMGILREKLTAMDANLIAETYRERPNLFATSSKSTDTP